MGNELNSMSKNENRMILVEKKEPEKEEQKLVKYIEKPNYLSD